MKQSNKELMTPITTDKNELAQKIKGAINSHPTTVEVSEDYSSNFIESLQKHLSEGYLPILDTATNLRGRVEMEKPDDILKAEHNQITLDATKEYDRSVRRKEGLRKIALKKEQDRIRAERNVKELEDELLNTKV
tara:strand:+ start:2195 stop:2599 length:405 start_codon:yes stop_codon:yes gene_type:complete